MDWGFSWLLAFVNQFWQILANVGTWAIEGVVWACKTVLYTVFDGLFIMVVDMLTAVNLGALATGFSAQMGLLPAQLAYLLNLVGISQGLGLVTTAILIRMGLNLIPSWVSRI